MTLPASTAAASLGRISVQNGYCSGNNTVNGTFKVHKNSGYFATRLTLIVKAQGYHGGSWVSEGTVGTASKNVNTSGQSNLTRYAWFNPGHAGKHRMTAIGRIWNGSLVVAKGNVRSGTCQ